MGIRKKSELIFHFSYHFYLEPSWVNFKTKNLKRIEWFYSKFRSWKFTFATVTSFILSFLSNLRHIILYDKMKKFNNHHNKSFPDVKNVMGRHCVYCGKSIPDQNRTKTRKLSSNIIHFLWTHSFSHNICFEITRNFIKWRQS